MNSDVTKGNKMGYQPIPTLLLSMALPMMMSMVVQALYNIVDSIFVARISEDALTAVSMAFPMQNLMIGCGTGLGVGTNALLSRCLGQRKPKEASNMAMHGLFIAVCAAITYLTLSFLISRSFFVMQNASDIIVEYGHNYLSIVMAFSICLYMQMMSERLLQATGKTVLSMYTQMLGAVTNIILDPILIFGLFGFPKMGIAGAAVATVFGQFLGACLGIYLNLTRNSEIHLSLKGFRPQLKIIGQILYIGVPSILVVGIGSIMTFSVNRILTRFTTTAVAVFGSYFKLQSFFFMPIFALNNAMVPIIAFNYGAKNAPRMLQSRRWAITYAEAIMLTAFAVMQIFPAQLLGLFNASPEMITMGVPALRTISISFPPAAFIIVTSSFFQAVGNGIYSMTISFMRQMVCLVPLVVLFASTGTLSLVWWAWPLAELVAVVCMLFFMGRVKRQIITPLIAETAGQSQI